MGGETAHTLNISEIPAHTHVPAGSSAGATVTSPSGALWATQQSKPYAGTADSAMKPASITATGGNQPHENMSPYLVLNFVIALQGIFPSPN